MKLCFVFPLLAVLAAILHAAESACSDKEEARYCVYWKKLGYCQQGQTYRTYMEGSCKRTCSFCQDCSTTPCLNGGTCRNSGDSFICSCVLGFEGKTCSKVNACARKPCKNGGVCTNSGNSFKCLCIGGFSGSTCETAPKPTNECKNSGKYDESKCKGWIDFCDKTSSFYEFMQEHCKETCGFCKKKVVKENCKDEDKYATQCPTVKDKYCVKTSKYFPWMSINCKKTCGLCRKAIPVNPCAKEPCRNGGVCTNSGSSFKCRCIGGYSGNTCETVLCPKEPCKNGGVCTNSGSSLKCRCIGGYSGNTCEIGPWGRCGKKGEVTGRVIAGEIAPANVWVWQAGLYIFDGFACGGSLINDQWVLTAAHCLYRKESKKDYMDVVLGDHERELHEGYEQKFRIDKFFIHPKYDDYNVVNDIALIKLNKTVDMTKPGVGLICLPNQGEATSLDSECYITGWGRTKAGGAPSILLMQAKLPPVSHAECSRQNNVYNGPQITKEMICGGDKPGSRKSGCQGDSGGPFVCTKDGTSYTLAGAVSWGSKDCKREEKYTVFARVSLFRDWIDETIRKN